MKKSTDDYLKWIDAETARSIQAFEPSDSSAGRLALLVGWDKECYSCDKDAEIRVFAASDIFNQNKHWSFCREHITPFIDGVLEKRTNNT